jgi:4-hydroxybenzoate polyprenyltransferase
MIQDIRGFAQFISVERGLMLFMIVVGATFLAGGSIAWEPALFLGALVFCIWSAVDAINNLCDVELDVLSDPYRARFTKKLGKFGLLVAACFSALSLAMGAITFVPSVLLFVVMGLGFGVLYSVPPFRLRKTPYKPLVNFTVGAVPMLIVAAFFNAFSANVLVLILLIGVTTAINSLWEDLADYASDLSSGSRTVPILLGYQKGLIVTVLAGYVMVPLMVLVGVLFELPILYYITLFGLACFITLRLIQKGRIISGRIKDTKKLFGVGDVLARDFVMTAVFFTLSLMTSSLLKIYLGV